MDASPEAHTHQEGLSEQHFPEDGTTRIHVYGQTLTVKGSREGDPYVQSLATYVTSHMERLARESPLTPLSQVAILASLNIAHELFQLKEQIAAREADIDARTRGLLDDIEAQFHTAPDT